MSPKPAKAISTVPIPILLERSLVAALTALIVARPLVSGEDPGRLRLTAGTGPVSFNFCVLLLLFATTLWRVLHVRHRASWPIVPLLLASVGMVAYISSQLADRYARPGLFVAWEWISLAGIVYLTRRLAASHADSRGLLNAIVASAVSVAALGLYQSLSGPLDLRPMDVVVADSSKLLAGTDEFYPELNQPPGIPKVTRGTFDSSETLLLFLFLTLPAALVLARTGRSTKRWPWILGFPALIAAGILAAILAKPFRDDSANWSAACSLIEHSPFLGVGPGNFTRVAGAFTGPTGAWFGLAATIGPIGLILMVAAAACTMRKGWPTNDPEQKEAAIIRPRWEFHLGGAAGLVFGFIWAYSEMPAESRADEVFNLGTAAVFRAAFWFAAFAVLEALRPSRSALVRAMLLGVGFVLAYGLVSDAPGRFTLLVQIFAMLALAGNLRANESTKPAGPWSRPLRGVAVILSAALAIGFLVTAALPAWATASAVRQARMASRHFPDKHREFERARTAPLKANALTASRNYLLGNIVLPLRGAADRDPGNAALWLEIARWRRPLWEYQLLADPEDAARVADETRKSSELAAQLDPQNLAAKRSLIEAFLLYRRNSKAREPERIVALNKLVGEIAEREPLEEVPLRFRIVRVLIERGEGEGLQAEVSTLLRLNRVEGSQHGKLTPDQRAEVIEGAMKLLKDPPKDLLEEWTR